MDEGTVEKIFKIYLEKREKKPIRMKKKQVHGPDFVVKGQAFECKGSEFEEKTLFDQIIRWGSQFSIMNLVLPYDALKNFRFIWQLEALEGFLRESPNLERSIGVYLIAEAGNQEYAICNWHSARMLGIEISTILHNLMPNFVRISSIKEKEKKILEFLDDIENRIKDEFRKLTIEKAKESENIHKGALIELKEEQ